ncbi:hypothetical protein RI129_007201 [Pyrocoelia pectoralis]|uniref:aralkylamine N-acetyltransferase n=1 Tax=Pyrocoelia pectoralis TaxID=417401 RepID=A0AAN7ZMB8_9COLE
MDGSKTYHVKLATEEDSEQIWEYTKKFFFPDEPLFQFLGLDQCISKDSFPTGGEERFSFIIAVDAYCNIIAICKIKLIKRDDPEVNLKSDNPKLQKIFDFIHYIDKEGDLFRKYPNVDQVLQVMRLSVDTSWRRRGVAQNLIMKVREIASNLDVPLIRMECSSYYSAQLALKMNFQCVYKKPYEEYLEHGKPIFSPEYPHKELGVYVYIM